MSQMEKKSKTNKQNTDTDKQIDKKKTDSLNIFKLALNG